MNRWLDLTLSPLAYIVLFVRRAWWLWAHHDSMKLAPCGQQISEQLQAINDLDNRMARIRRRWEGR